MPNWNLSFLQKITADHINNFLFVYILSVIQNKITQPQSQQLFALLVNDIEQLQFFLIFGKNYIERTQPKVVFLHPPTQYLGENKKLRSYLGLYIWILLIIYLSICNAKLLEKHSNCKFIHFLFPPTVRSVHKKHNKLVHLL